MSPTCPASLAAITSPPITAPAPVEVSSGNRKNPRPAVATRQPARRPRDPPRCDHPRSGSRHSGRVARTTTRSWPREGPARKRSAASSARSATPSLARLRIDARTAAVSPAKGPGGRPGNDSASSAGQLTPRMPALRTSSLPDPAPAYDLAPLRAHRRSRFRGKPGQPLDTESKEDSFCIVSEFSNAGGGDVPNWMFCHRSALADAGAPGGVISAVRSRVADGREGREAEAVPTCSPARPAGRGSRRCR